MSRSGRWRCFSEGYSRNPTSPFQREPQRRASHISVEKGEFLRNEYLVTENRILKNQIEGRLQFTDPERISLAEMGQRLSRKALEKMVKIARPETIRGEHWTLVAMEFDGSKGRPSDGRAVTPQAIAEMVLKFARGNRSWGYRRIGGAITNLGHEISHQSLANVLKRHGLLPAPGREERTTWRELIRTHTEILVGVDYFSAEVWVPVGLITDYVRYSCASDHAEGGSPG